MWTSVLTLGLLAASFSRAAPAAASAYGAVYTLNNNEQNATIIAMSLSMNGTIYGTPVSTPTGGKGGKGQTGKGQPNVGSLFSSDSVTAADDYLFVVNAGSNTVSMFSINPTDPLHPTLVGKPADTLGDFPVSLAYSSSLSMLCVLNGGATAGVTCFDVNPSKGLTTNETAPRSISKGLNQTTPPTGPFSTASDLRFNPSSSALFASTKGSPVTKPISNGYLFAWPVKNGQVAQDAVVSKPSSLVLDFSLSFIGTDFDLLITDPAIGADFLSVSSSWEIAVQKPVNVTYQKAVCWSYYDPATECVFLADAAQSNITILSAVDGSIKQTVDFTASVEGGQDMVMAGNSLYVLSSSGPLVNINVGGLASGTPAAAVQTVSPVQSSELNRDQFQGIAVWVSKNYM